MQRTVSQESYVPAASATNHGGATRSFQATRNSFHSSRSEVFEVSIFPFLRRSFNLFSKWISFVTSRGS